MVKVRHRLGVSLPKTTLIQNQKDNLGAIMPLSSNSIYGVEPLTKAINKIPAVPTTIRSKGIFKPEFLTTTTVKVEEKEGILSLVQSRARGVPGEPVAESRKPPKSFETIHLVKNDIVYADEVQNVRAFGKTTAETVQERVLGKAAAMKNDIELTREHLMLGALKGKILDADGTEIYDIYREFGLTRAEHNWQLSNDKTNVSTLADKLHLDFAKKARGETIGSLISFVSAEFMETLINHKSVYEVYLRLKEAQQQREGDTHIHFWHKNIDFIVYADDFASGLKIGADEAIVLPSQSRNAFKEFFAPADMSSTVNSVALPYYLTREPLKHDTGWDLRAQSNPLPLVLRPDLVQTIKLV